MEIIIKCQLKFIKHPLNLSNEKYQIIKQRYSKKYKNSTTKGTRYSQNSMKVIKYNYDFLIILGILLDQESWYSVTPELLSKHIAKRFKN